MLASGIGGKTPEQALASLSDMMADVAPITVEEHLGRIAKIQEYMVSKGIDALYLNAGTNLTYFSGLRWYPSERLVGAILPAQGEIQYIAPDFEVGSLNGYMMIESPMHTWLEHECPYALVKSVLQGLGLKDTATLAVDEAAPYFLVDGLKQAMPQVSLISAQPLTSHCRMCKS